MSLFHRHHWTEVKRYFVPPVNGDLEIERGTATIMREAFQGITVVELRCDGCGDVESRRLQGDAR